MFFTSSNQRPGLHSPARRIGATVVFSSCCEPLPNLTLMPFYLKTQKGVSMKGHSQKHLIRGKRAATRWEQLISFFKKNSFKNFQINNHIKIIHAQNSELHQTAFLWASQSLEHISSCSMHAELTGGLYEGNFKLNVLDHNPPSASILKPHLCIKNKTLSTMQYSQHQQGGNISFASLNMFNQSS